MTGEMVTFKASAGAVAVTLSDVIASYKRTRTVNHGKLVLLEMQADAALRIARARGTSSLAQINIEEIAATQRLIDSLNLYGPALDHAMRQLETLSYSLAENLRGFGHA
ncbi:MAG TPA: hypothetical protein VGH27_09775 [Streptosporangiaceae bacterium]|jgi:hypothetical protein